MDNVTHSLAAALIAEAVVLFHGRRFPDDRQSAVFPRAVLFTSLLANNLPDADILYTSITPAPLGYLLHHRGHTHTLLVALVLGALAALAVIAVVRRKWTLSRRQAATVGVVGVIGPFAHIAMDAGNIYGVHPFWPLHDGWFFGDSIFILEPLFWVAALPVLIAQARSPGWRVVLGLLLALGVGLPWLLPGYVPIGIRLLIAGLALAISVVAWKAPPVTRLGVSAGAWLVIASLFVFLGISARGNLKEALQSAFAGERILDLALTPMPANPFCWAAIAVSTDSQDHIVIRRATAAPIPALIPAPGCPTMMSNGTAPMSPIGAADDPGLDWHDQFRAPASELRRLASERCEVAALLRFVRVPYWTTRSTDSATIVGDLRFDRGSGLDFADLAVPRAPSHCPPFVPPWTPPRADLLH